MASVVSGLFLFGISFLLAAHRLHGGGDPEIPNAPMWPQAIGASAGSSTSGALVYSRLLPSARPGNSSAVLLGHLSHARIIGTPARSRCEGDQRAPGDEPGRAEGRWAVILPAMRRGILRLGNAEPCRAPCART